MYCFVDVNHKTKKNYPPVLLSIANMLSKLGWKAAVYPQGMEIPDCKFLIIQTGIGNYGDAITLARNTNADIKVVIGDYITVEPVDVMRCPLFDYGIIGDPDSAIVDLVLGKNPRHITGVVYRYRGGLVIKQGKRFRGSEYLPSDYSLWQGEQPETANLYQARTLYPDSHIWYRRGSHKRKSKNIFTDEVISLLKVGTERVRLADEVFLARGVIGAVRLLDRFSEWSCSSTVLDVLENRLDQRLRSSGCKTVYLHVVSGCPTMLSSFCLHDIRQAELAIDLLYDGANINVVPVVTIGIPGESVNSLKQTISWLRGIDLKSEVRTFVPVPGSIPYQDPGWFNVDFMVTGTNWANFFIDDSIPIDCVPWKSCVISEKDFVSIRNEMVQEFNLSY